MVIHQFSYLLEKGFGKDLGDGRYIYGSYPELQSEYFPIWSERTLQRTLLAGEHFGLVKSKQPERNCSRRKYYALTSEGANLASSGKKASSMPQNGTLQDDAKMASSSYIKNKNSSKHEHDHDYGSSSSSSHQHDHVHGPYGCSVVELQPPEQDLLNQIEELTERENRTEHYRTTWSMRIRDHPNDVFKAIGQTRLDAREGKIKKSIGGMLNWHFEKFRKASAKAPRKWATRRAHYSSRGLMGWGDRINSKKSKRIWRISFLHSGRRLTLHALAAGQLSNGSINAQM